MTFSLVARCPQTGMFGLAISSSSPAVAARCAFARAGVGAVSSQNITDPSLGPKMLDAMQAGKSAADAIANATDGYPHTEYRQLLAVDRHGGTAIRSGEHALGIWGEAFGENVASAGNLLESTSIPQAIVDGFLSATGHLGDRLIAAMQAGLAAGGEAGPVRSAGLMMVDKLDWPVTDLRCDWSDECPIAELAKLWDIYKPELEPYVRRALDPGNAPAFGVAGDA